MSLKETIAADAATVFLNGDEFAETVTLYKSGDYLQSVAVSAIVVWDELEGTREAFGDGVMVEHDSGSAIRQSLKLELAVGVDVDDTRRPADLFKLEDGTMVVVKRILGKDGGMQTVLCTRRDNISIRKPVKSG
jgi:hypothetical protein